MFVNTTPPSWTTGTNVIYYKGLRYGNKNKLTLDVIIPSDATEITPAIINIHGGSFVFGSKENSYDTADEQAEIMDYLDAGIAYISINYSLLTLYNEKEGIIKSMQSCVNALQFIKYYSPNFNIDKSNIALSGGSAGAGIALWIASNPNFADSTNLNQILREDTDVKAIALQIPQASYDFQVWEDRVFNMLGYTIYQDYILNEQSRNSTHRSYAIDSFSKLFEQPTIALRASLDMLGLIDIHGGVPTFIKCDNPFNTTIVNGTIQDINHNDYHGLAIKNALDAKGVENITYLDGLNVADASGKTKSEFLMDILSPQNWSALIIADGGTIEDADKIQIELNKSKRASMAMIPGAYKPGVLYCPIPIDRSADFTVSRAYPVNTIGLNGELRNLGNNVPAIDHSEGYPRLLTPDLSTNLFLNNAVLVTQNVSTTIDTYTISFYGTGTIEFSGSYAGLDLVGTGINQRVTRTFTAANGTLTVEVTGSCTNAQMELLTYASPPITTLGSAISRPTDIIQDGGSSTCINSQEGVFIFKGKAFSPGAFRMLTISDGTNNNRVGISYDNGGNLLVFFTVGGVSIASYTFASSSQTNENEITFMWQLNNFKIYLNEVEVFAQNSGVVPSPGTFTEVSFANGNGGLPFKADTKAILIYDQIAKATLDYSYIIE